MCGQWLSPETEGWMDGGSWEALGPQCKDTKIQGCGPCLSPSGEGKAGLLSSGEDGNSEGMDTGHLISQVFLIKAGEDRLLVTIK